MKEELEKDLKELVTQSNALVAQKSNIEENLKLVAGAVNYIQTKLNIIKQNEMNAKVEAEKAVETSN